MKKITFSGELRSLNPEKIIKERENNKVDNFFLILGLIYNDLKSLVFYTTKVNEHFNKNDTNIVNTLSGEYHGMRTHLNRLITSTIHEFFVFIENQNRIIESEGFKIIFDKVTPQYKKLWQQIFDIAMQKNLTKKGDDFKTILESIRNNGSYHYYSSGQGLRNGYIDHFYTRHNQHEANKKAYYSKGKCMEEVRYFYCDAAVLGYNYKCVQSKFDHKDYSESLLEITEIMNVAITKLMTRYISSRK